jgi:predicted house-cleaning noncanonical NTP pyrophosphatase (MazG superfamily)
MGWKIVRDNNEAWSRAHGVSGQWRACATPMLSLTKKLFEEAGEWVESGDAGELYDLADVLDQLLLIADPDGSAHRAHAAKLAEMGAFGRLIEWCPVPEEGNTGEAGATDG